MSDTDTNPTPEVEPWETPLPEDAPAASPPDPSEYVTPVDPLDGVLNDDDAGYSHSDPIDPLPADGTISLSPEVAPAATDTPDAVIDTSAPASTRGPRTNLELDLFHVCNDLATGKVVLAQDVKPSPHVLAKLVHERRNAAAAEAGTINTLNSPSSGAVNATLARWAEIGFINLQTKPVAFAGFTQAGVDKGLTAIKADFRANKASARAAEKAAAAPAPVEAAPVEAAPVADETATAAPVGAVQVETPVDPF